MNLEILYVYLWPGLWKYGMWAHKIDHFFRLFLPITIYSIIAWPWNFQSLSTSYASYLAIQYKLQKANIEIWLIKWHSVVCTHWHMPYFRRPSHIYRKWEIVCASHNVSHYHYTFILQFYRNYVFCYSKGHSDRTSLDRRRLEAAHFRFAVLSVQKSFPEIFSDVAIKSDTHSILAEINEKFYQAFRCRYSGIYVCKYYIYLLRM